MLAGLVDCATIYCPSAWTKTATMLAEARPGDVVQVVLGTGSEASELLKDCADLGLNVVSIDQDRVGNFRLEIEKGD